MNFITTVWAGISSEAGQVWCLGFGFAAFIKIFKTALRWLRAAAGGGGSDCGQ